MCCHSEEISKIFFLIRTGSILNIDIKINGRGTETRFRIMKKFLQLKNYIKQGLKEIRTEKYNLLKYQISI